MSGDPPSTAATVPARGNSATVSLGAAVAFIALAAALGALSTPRPPVGAGWALRGTLPGAPSPGPSAPPPVAAPARSGPAAGLPAAAKPV